MEEKSTLPVHFHEETTRFPETDGSSCSRQRDGASIASSVVEEELLGRPQARSADRLGLGRENTISGEATQHDSQVEISGDGSASLVELLPLVPVWSGPWADVVPTIVTGQPGREGTAEASVQPSLNCPYNYGQDESEGSDDGSKEGGAQQVDDLGTMGKKSGGGSKNLRLCPIPECPKSTQKVSRHLEQYHKMSKNRPEASGIPRLVRN